LTGAGERIRDLLIFVYFLIPRPLSHGDFPTMSMVRFIFNVGANGLKSTEFQPFNLVHLKQTIRNDFDYCKNAKYSHVIEILKNKR
jgi:hypothetical protein